MPPSASVLGKKSADVVLKINFSHVISTVPFHTQVNMRLEPILPQRAHQREKRFLNVLWVQVLTGEHTSNTPTANTAIVI